MTQFQRVSLLLLRLTLGWLMFYAGITKLMNPAWTAFGYLANAKTMSGLFAWFSSPAVLPFVNFMNEWALTLLGAALILGVFVRLGAILGSLLMLLYYIPILDFPYPNPHSYIVDEHIIYVFALLILAAFRAGRVWGLENWCANLPICSRYPRLRSLLG